MKLRITLLALALGAASTAPAAQLPVHYSVDFKEFKRVDAGTALDFEIFSDEACSIPVHFETLVAGDPGLRQEKVLSQKVKNQSPKPPLEMRLKTTLDLAQSASSAFLKVTGAGVIPIGGACQSQFSVPGSAPGFVAVDADGDLIGPMLGLFHVGIPVGAGLPYEIPLVNGALASGLPNVNNEDVMYYASADCSGPPQMSVDPRPWETVSIFSRVIVRGGVEVLRKVPAGTNQAYGSRSGSHGTTDPNNCSSPQDYVPPGGCCFVGSGTRVIAAPDVLDITDITGPITIALR